MRVLRCRWGRGQLRGMKERHVCRVVPGRARSSRAGNRSCRLWMQAICGSPSRATQVPVYENRLLQAPPLTHGHIPLQKAHLPSSAWGSSSRTSMYSCTVCTLYKSCMGVRASSSPPPQALHPHLGAVSAWKKKGFYFGPKSQPPARALFMHPEEHIFLIHAKALKDSVLTHLSLGHSWTPLETPSFSHGTINA